MPLSAASALRASSLALLLLLLLAATATSRDGSATTTAISGNSSSVPRPTSDDTETYLCYLCDKRNPMLIKYCPIYWDWCHLMCYDGGDVVAAEPTASLRPVAAPAAVAPLDDVYGQDCYVMKLYRNGSYVIVSHHDCSRMASCILNCGGGVDVAGSPVAAAAPQGMLPPSSRVAEFQRCGDQAMALPTRAVPGRV